MHIAHSQSQPVPDSRPNQQAQIDIRRMLRSELAQEFGSLALRAVDPHLNRIVFKEGRSEIREQEIEALRTAVAFDAGCGLIEEVALEDADRQEILRDVFEIALEQSSLGTARPFIVRATVCPDYPFDPKTKTYLTTGGLGCGVGLCAERMTGTAVKLAALLAKLDVPGRVELCFADTEAHDSAMLAKSGLTQNEFLGRIYQSMVAAVGHVQAELQRAGIEVPVHGIRMTTIISAGLQSNTSIEVDDSRIYGVERHRETFYRRFFSEQIRTVQDLNAFVRARAERDILEHLNLGHAVSKAREGGEHSVLLTFSIPALCNFFNYGVKRRVPILRMQQDY